MWDCFLAGDHVPRNHRPSVEILTTTGLCYVGRCTDHRRSARRGSEEKQEQRPSAIVTVHIRFNGHMRRKGWTVIQTRSTRSCRDRYLFLFYRLPRDQMPRAAGRQIEPRGHGLNREPV